MGSAPPPHYDEFGLFADNAAEAGIPWKPPTVRRQAVDVGAGRRVSSLVWGEGPPELVLLHGGGQNAHTWDTVALALDRPLVAVDLPGHGHSDWPGDARAVHPGAMADDVAAVIGELAPGLRALVGMSLGGLTALALAARSGVTRWHLSLTHTGQLALALVVGERTTADPAAAGGGVATPPPPRP